MGRYKPKLEHMLGNGRMTRSTARGRGRLEALCMRGYGRWAQQSAGFTARSEEERLEMRSLSAANYLFSDFRIPPTSYRRLLHLFKLGPLPQQNNVTNTHMGNAGCGSAESAECGATCIRAEMADAALVLSPSLSCKYMEMIFGDILKESTPPKLLLLLLRSYIQRCSNLY